MDVVAYSNMFSRLLDDIKATSGRCPKCHSFYHSTTDQAFIAQTGRCLECDLLQKDHVQGDIQDQEKLDALDMIHFDLEY